MNNLELKEYINSKVEKRKFTISEIKGDASKRKYYRAEEENKSLIIMDSSLEKGNFNNILNIPLEAGITAEEYLNAYEHVLKKLKEFKPEFVLFSAGFDAHIDDPLAQLRLNSEDFYQLTKRTLEISKSFCNGNVVSILEGGYDLKALQTSSKRHVDALIEFN